LETVQKNNAAGACVPYPYAYTVSPPPRRGLRRCTSGWPGRSGRARALGSRGRGSAISVLITADVAVSSRGLINYSYYTLLGVLVLVINNLLLVCLPFPLSVADGFSWGIMAEIR